MAWVSRAPKLRISKPVLVVYAPSHRYQPRLGVEIKVLVRWIKKSRYLRKRMKHAWQRERTQPQEKAWLKANGFIRQRDCHRILKHKPRWYPQNATSIQLPYQTFRWYIRAEIEELRLKELKRLPKPVKFKVKPEPIRIPLYR
jgi:hypothetical protein